MFSFLTTGLLETQTDLKKPQDFKSTLSGDIRLALCKCLITFANMIKSLSTNQITNSSQFTPRSREQEVEFAPRFNNSKKRCNSTVFNRDIVLTACVEIKSSSSHRMLFFALFASLIRIGLLSDQSCRYDLIKAQSNQCCCCSSGHKYKYTKYKYKHKYTNQSWLKLNQIRAADAASKLNSNSLTLHINSN